MSVNEWENKVTFLKKYNVTQIFCCTFKCNVFTLLVTLKSNLIM